MLKRVSTRPHQIPVSYPVETFRLPTRLLYIQNTTATSALVLHHLPFLTLPFDCLDRRAYFTYCNVNRAGTGKALNIFAAIASFFFRSGGARLVGEWISTSIVKFLCPWLCETISIKIIQLCYGWFFYFWKWLDATLSQLITSQSENIYISTAPMDPNMDFSEKIGIFLLPQ